MHDRSYSKVFRGLIFLVGLFFLNFTSRVLFSPLLPTLANEFGLDHAAAGSVFLLISIGYFLSILSSGFVSARINHKNTISLSTIASGFALLLLSFSSTVLFLRVGLFSLGMAAGLYLPSGLASISRMVASPYLARGMAVHELAPNFGFIAAPVLTDMMLKYCSWHQGLRWLGIVMIGAGAIYGLAGHGCQERGTILDRETVQTILWRSEFWFMVLLFSLAICSSLGVYAMLPLFLVSDQGVTPERASRLLALSRITALLMPLFAGWLGDKVGNRLIMIFVLVLAGVLTTLLGFPFSSFWLIVIVIIQPMVAVCFFPSGFTVLSKIGSEEKGPVAISLCIPLAFLLGGGVLPVLIGIIGDHASIGVGFMVTGIVMISGVVYYAFFGKTIKV